MYRDGQPRPEEQIEHTAKAGLTRRDFLKFLGLAFVATLASGAEGCAPSAPEKARLKSLEGIYTQPVGSRELFVEVQTKYWKQELIDWKQNSDSRDPKNARWVITLQRADANNTSNNQSPHFVQAELTIPRQTTLLFMFIDANGHEVNNARAESKFK